MKNISQEGLKLIKSFEGCHLTTYDDLQPKIKLTANTKIKGTLTIGWGHTGSDVTIGKTITQEQADRLLIMDLTKFVGYVNNINYVMVTDRLNQNQFDALVSFAYNCGQGNLKTLCANRSIPQIANKIPEYNKSNGIVLAGLVRRREAEKQLFERAIKPIEQVELDYGKRIEELETIVKNIVTGLTKISETLSQVPAPEWFINEFPNATDMLSQKTGTIDFWRAFALTLRIIKISS